VRLSDDVNRDSSVPTAKRRELIQELYKLHTLHNDGLPTAHTLAKWLELKYKMGNLELIPDPAECAITIFTNTTLASSVHGAAIIWLWNIADSRLPDEAQRIRDAIKEFCFQYFDSPGIVPALASLLAKHLNNLAVRQFIIDWIRIKSPYPKIYQILSPLVAAYPNDDEVRKLAVDWLAANQTHPHSYWLLSTFIAANSSNPEIRKLALGWFTANRTHQHSNVLLMALVAASPDDPEVKKLALDWLAANETHSSAEQLLLTLVAAGPNDSIVMEHITKGMYITDDHPAFYKLLSVLIARSEDTDEWIVRGEQYVKKLGSVHPQVVIAVLLTRGKAYPKFIEMAFNFIEETTNNGHRKFLLFHLSRALVRNFHNAVNYLSGTHNEQRKKMVCASMALGMKRFPVTIATFALNVVDSLEPDYVYHILRNVITRRMDVDYLDEMIAQWLTNNYRRRGYGGMLDALQKNPAFWDRLLAINMVPKKVVEDFNGIRNRT
jgi:hypothetical protein